MTSSGLISQTLGNSLQVINHTAGVQAEQHSSGKLNSYKCLICLKTPFHYTFCEYINEPQMNLPHSGPGPFDAPKICGLGAFSLFSLDGNPAWHIQLHHHKTVDTH